LELHLHPRWQREVVEKLRTSFPNIQFIATTHSPFIIQSLRPGELITLDPDEFGEYANRSVEDIAEHVMGVEVPQKSERYLEMMKAAEEYYRLLRDAPDRRRRRKIDSLNLPCGSATTLPIRRS
jgi:predicted ATP-binding protein involved in virulence